MNRIKIPDNLRDAIASRRCVALVGAGASQTSSFPSWKKLLETLVSDGRREGIIKPTEEKEIKQSLKDSSKYLDIAQYLADRFGEADIRSRISKIFDDSSKVPSALHKSLMDINFRFLVTTNYDRLLENAYAAKHGTTPTIFTQKNVDDFADALWENKFFILKAHGDVASRTSIVLTQRDYREIIFTSPGYRHLLASIFTNYMVLFIGASLSDPEVNLMLASLHSAFHGSGKKHFALIEEASTQEFMIERWRKDYNINAIKYKKSDNSHPEVLDFVKRLKGI